MDIVAHRGYGEAFPENTRLAFTTASETADWIEFDVRSCATGELVVFHDENLDRLTDATGPINAKSWEELQELEILDSGESILQLKDALSLIPAKVNLQIEIKEYGLAERVLSITEHAPHAIRYLSFSPIILHEISTNSQNAELGHILHPHLFEGNPKLGIDLTTHLDCTTVHLYYQMIQQSDQQLTDLAQRHGLDIQVGLDREVAMTETEILKEYADLGVDYVSVDKPLSRESIEILNSDRCDYLDRTAN